MRIILTLYFHSPANSRSNSSPAHAFPIRPLKKAHLLRYTFIASLDVPEEYACARRFLARLASETFLTGLKPDFIFLPRESFIMFTDYGIPGTQY
jgi:hypothetical protein